MSSLLLFSRLHTVAKNCADMRFTSILLAAATAALSSAQDIPTLEAALNSTESLSTLNTLLASYPDCKYSNVIYLKSILTNFSARDACKLHQHHHLRAQQ